MGRSDDVEGRLSRYRGMEEVGVLDCCSLALRISWGALELGSTRFQACISSAIRDDVRGRRE